MRCSSICAVWAKVLRPGLLGLLERVRSLGRLLIGHRLPLRQLMLHAEFLHRNLMLGLHLVGVHLSLQRTPHRDKRRYSVQDSSRADRRHPTSRDASPSSRALWEAVCSYLLTYSPGDPILGPELGPEAGLIWRGRSTS